MLFRESVISTVSAVVVASGPRSFARPRAGLEIRMWLRCKSLWMILIMTLRLP